jgi:ribosomal protein S4
MFEQHITVSKGEARRLIHQGAVKVNGVKVFDPLREIGVDDEITIGFRVRND